MHQVVEEVAAERLDGEQRTVAARAWPVPLVAGDSLVEIRQVIRGRIEFKGHRRRILQVVAFLDRRLVLIPVLEDGTILVEHSPQPVRPSPIDVAHVTAVLQCRPAVLARTDAGQRVPKEARPRQSGVTTSGRDLGARERATVESTFLTRALEHPHPTLRLRIDQHECKLFDVCRAAAGIYSRHSSCSASSRNSSGTDVCDDSTTPAYPTAERPKRRRTASIDWSTAHRAAPTGDPGRSASSGRIGNSSCSTG